MTQAEVAKYAGVTASNIAAYEAGTRPMSQAMQRRLEHAMVRPSEALALHAYAVKARLEKASAHNVRVFGSIARGQDLPASDIDLLVDVDQDTDAFSLSAARLDLVDLLGFEVELVSARAVPPSKHGILAEAVPL